MAFAIGENVGVYRVVAQLGQGGMATVYKAYHPGLDRYVALKVLHPSFQEDATFVQRFNREARIVARLEHPNIVPVYDFAEHKGLAYLVMRFIDGETLKAWLKRGRLEPAQIVQIANKVAAALGYAHRQGILHRDIKPSNIMLTGNLSQGGPQALGEVYLTDFGLARIAAAGESTMSRDVMMGTPQYISPEQAKGVQELDEGTDIYSLGVVFFEMVTGRVPFSADTPYSIIHDHIFSPLPLPSTIDPKVPEAVERVLLKALAKERADRYPDVEAYVAAFVKALEGEVLTVRRPLPIETLEAPTVQTPLPPVSSEPVTAPVDQASPRKKRRTWLYVGGAALLLLCLCAALALAGQVVERRQAAATATAEAVATAVIGPEDRPTGDPELADKIASLEEIVSRHPEDPQAHLELGRLYLQAGRPAEAEEQFRLAIELRPPEEAIYLEVADYLVRTGRMDLAAEALIIGLEALPESKPLRIQTGKVLWLLGAPENDPERAEELTRRLVEANPQDPLAHVFLARVLISQGKMEEARREIDAALEAAPQMGEAHLVNGLWFRRNRQFVEARREFRLALEFGVSDEWLKLEIEREIANTPQ